MAEQNNNSDKLTFKVKHLDEYHEIVIDPNDERYEDKHQQLFEQLESITGVPSRYTTEFILRRNMNPSDVNNTERYLWSFYNQKAFAPDIRRFSTYRDIFSLNIRDGERFHLQYFISYGQWTSKRISMRYALVEERDVPEVGCIQGYCHSRCTEPYFKRLKDLVNNDAMNAKITQLVQPLFESGNSAEVYKIFRDFNIKQYLYPSCDEGYRRRLAVNGHAHQIDLYSRTRG
ncbi:uncharacterized protein LOC112538468 [Tetranychus urticae]|uniref:uncharacterized protein LOC112538468 n=1 Tax=Tetranychus urticae TaxID=32264 RepID=UPI000D64E5AE|nr:uncharacterized protein LOC112538468 [Tetranychus urticae]